MRLRTDLFAALSLAIAVSSCSNVPTPTTQGALWPYRDRIVEEFDLRKGKLTGAHLKPVRSCYRTWAYGLAEEDSLGQPDCDKVRDQLRLGLKAALGIEVPVDALNDRALWDYVAPRAKL